jgi:hypothetical protein
MRCGLARCALVVTVATAACGTPTPPPVAVRQPSLDADDVAVIRGVLDSMRRQRERGGHFLVVDTTVAVCESPIAVVAPPPGGCLAPPVLDDVSKVLPLHSRVTALLGFQARNAKRLPVTGGLGADVDYVSATFIDFAVGKLGRDLPRGSAIVTFSAPSYPAPGVAVVAYRVKESESGAVRLQQQPDGRWAVADRHGAIE